MAKEKGGRNGPSDIRTDPEYECLVPPMSKQESDELEKSIRKDGLLVPIIVDQDHCLVDGHHRFKICRKLGIEPKFEVRHFDTRQDAMDFIMEINFLRRHLNHFQKIETVERWRAIETERARKRRLGSLRKGKVASSLVQNDPNGDRGRVIDICGRKAGVSANTYKKGQEIIEHGSEALKERLRRGELRINTAHRQLVLVRDDKAPRRFKSAFPKPKHEATGMSKQEQDLMNELASARKTIDMQKDEIATYKQKLAEVSKATAKEDSDKIIWNLQNQLKNQDEMLELKVRENAELQKENKRLSQEVEKTINEKNDLQRNIETHVMEVLIKEKKPIQDEIEQRYRAEIDEKECALKKVEAEKEALLDRINRLEADLEFERDTRGLDE